MLARTEALDLKRRQKRKLKVLQVFDSLGTGGAETWLLALLKYFHDHGDDLDVNIQTDICLTSGQRTSLDDAARQCGANLFYLPYRFENSPQFANAFRRLLVNGKYDAIHDQQGIAAGLHFLLGTGVLPRIRIAHFHNPKSDLADAKGGNVVKASRRRLGLLGIKLAATDVLGTSRACLEEHGLLTNTFSHLRPRALYCGFDPARFRGEYIIEHESITREFGWHPADKVMLFVGRFGADDGVQRPSFEARKNPQFAFDVARACIQRDERVRLIMVGSGEAERARFQSLVSSFQLDDKIRLSTVRNDVPRLMAGADLLLFPSRTEGLGMVAVEAQASGLRVLASDAVPNDCSIVPGMVTFYPLDEGVTAWAQQALELLYMPRPDHSSANQQIDQSKFSIKNSAQDLIDAYGHSRTIKSV